tara:strand:- start:656 stop:760 length:105 start_codon:yes stop_codon:yes gene_type:complete
MNKMIILAAALMIGCSEKEGDSASDTGVDAATEE